MKYIAILYIPWIEHFINTCAYFSVYAIKNRINIKHYMLDS